MASSTAPIPNIQQLTGYAPEEQGAKTNDLLDRDVFLNLLVTQIQYQDPLDPMENQEFTSQLAQLSMVEEMRTNNEHLVALQLYESSINNAQSVSLIGKEIKALGDSVCLAGLEGEDLYFRLDDPAERVEITIFDEDKNTVATITKNRMEEGDQNVFWNGKDSNGSPLPEGNYTFEVRATDKSGEELTVQTFLAGRVEGKSGKETFSASGYASPYLSAGSEESESKDLKRTRSGASLAPWIPFISDMARLDLYARSSAETVGGSFGSTDFLTFPRLGVGVFEGRSAGIESDARLFHVFGVSLYRSGTDIEGTGFRPWLHEEDPTWLPGRFSWWPPVTLKEDGADRDARAAGWPGGLDGGSANAAPDAAPLRRATTGPHRAASHPGSRRRRVCWLG